MNRNLLPFDGTVFYFPNVFEEKIFAKLNSEIEWTDPKIKIFGKEMNQPRRVAWYGDENCEYHYSGKTWIPNCWTPELKQINSKVEKVAHSKFNGVLTNLYRDGNDSMGWHSDDEKELGENPVIASVSFGGNRTFQMKHKIRREKFKIDLESGSVLIMKDETQKFWQHAVLKTKRECAPRINLTFRSVNPVR